MNIFFSVFSILFFLMFCLVFCLIAVQLVRGLKQRNINNNSPRLTVEAKVAAKRTEISHHHHHSGDDMHFSTTSNSWHYVTFEVESGDRMEFAVSGRDYGMLVEGDFGRLTFQGTRYLGFERRIG